MRGRTLTSKPMCDLLGVSWKVLKGWCDEIAGFEESGAFERGAEGIGYNFRPIQTVRFLIKHFEAAQSRQVAATKQFRRAVAGNALDALPEDMSADEIIKSVRLAREVREEQQSQGILIRADEAATTIQEMLGSMLQAGMQAGREQDPTGQWPPEYAEKWQRGDRQPHPGAEPRW